MCKTLPSALQCQSFVEPLELKVLQLRYEQGFNDRAIARKLKVSDRTIRNYWMRIQATLQIKDDNEKDTKVAIGLAARKFGLIR